MTPPPVLKMSASPNGRLTRSRYGLVIGNGHQLGIETA